MKLTDVFCRLPRLKIRLVIVIGILLTCKVSVYVVTLP